jgi:GH24 family phage-related lysozyme (muramidase)
MTLAISPIGLALVQEYEGFRAQPAQLPDGDWVVGHGHVRLSQAGGAVTQTEASHLLALDLAPFERLVNSKVIKALTQSQFDGLVSFAFSIGAEAFAQSQVLRRVNSGDFVAAACAMDAWRKSDVGGELEIIGALVARRAAEKALFLKGLALDASPSALMRAKLDHAASILGAPTRYAPASQFASASLRQLKPDPARRLTEILRSEPATEALLLTQVASVEDVSREHELVTAHARPVARKLKAMSWDKRSAFKVRFNVSQLVENFGLVALLLFGLVLVSLGGSMLLSGRGDGVDLLGASALGTPGLAAAFIAAFGLWRGPQAEPVKV